MPLSPFTPSIGPEIRAQILEKLQALAEAHQMRILFAVESGSRAWGFPSPDSDYDLRFVYVGDLDRYLSLTPGRDVIEEPIVGDLDLGGWDLRKALGLMLKPNPTLLEWLSSPIRYLWDEEACATLQALAAKIAHRGACRKHYLGLGEGQWRDHLGAEGEEVRAKKYFYILRPALALRWIRLRPETPPPMNLQALVAGLDLPSEAVERIGELIDLKSRLGEGARIRRLPEIDALMRAEFEAAREAPPEPEGPDHRQEATALFRRLVLEGSGALDRRPLTPST